VVFPERQVQILHDERFTVIAFLNARKFDEDVVTGTGCHTYSLPYGMYRFPVWIDVNTDSYWYTSPS
jgi:hypothetical protein